LGAKDQADTLGKTSFDFFPRPFAEKFYADDLQIIRSGNSMIEKEEIVVSLASGNPAWHLTTKVPLRNREGILIGLLGVSRDITERKRDEEKIKSLLAERELILKEVHHRIKNNMGTMISLLSLQANTTKEPSALRVLMDAENRLRSMEVLYDKLYRSENLREISAKDYLPTLIRQIVDVFPNGGNVKTVARIDDFIIGVKELSSLGIIVNEILTNTMKYAFVGKESGLIEVTASKIENRVTITMGDDGVGIPESVDIGNSKGFGLMLVDSLTRQLNGSMRIERGKGTRFILEFGDGPSP
jgi:two-component sensor histidine kinase